MKCELKERCEEDLKRQPWILRNMNSKPKCIIVTGRAGSGKTTLARKLGERLHMPLISRDEIKEGYVNTYGVKHDQLPPNTNGVVSDLFFEIVNQYLKDNFRINEPCWMQSVAQ